MSALSQFINFLRLDQTGQAGLSCSKGPVGRKIGLFPYRLENQKHEVWFSEGQQHLGNEIFFDMFQRKFIN